MTKDDARSAIMGAISMALKDPVLQQVFEIICKENAELKTKKIPQLERKIASIRGCHSVDVKKLNARTEQVERLKKENAELEEENKMLAKGYVWHDYDAGEDCYEDSHEGRWVKRNEIIKLKQAKEIIKSFSEFVNNEVEYDSEHPQEHTDLWNELCEQAEQFLKEVSE